MLDMGRLIPVGNWQLEPQVEAFILGKQFCLKYGVPLLGSAIQLGLHEVITIICEE